MAADLQDLYGRIARRCRAVSEAHADWPCTKGCDACCRRLAEPPRATEAEWKALFSVLATLPPAVQAGVRERVAEMARLAAQPEPPRHYVCPMLDRPTGACLVYEGRFAACRTYGFYVAREKGDWCDRVRLLAEEREVLLGNADAVDADLSVGFGAVLGIAEAFGR